ncbi:MAG: lactonase family protein [Alistipes sp.]|nr:lactonase family protein [Alistipes sp.]
MSMAILVGTNTPYWGHTFLAEGNDKIYALRSLSGSSSLCVFDGTQLKGQGGLVELSSLQAMMAEGTTPGEHSCHITLLDREAVVADYTSGTLTLYPLAADGSLEGEPRIVHFSGSGPHPKRQLSPHIHSSSLSPDKATLIVADLGTDRLYRFDVKQGRAVMPYTPVVLPEGCGPRHTAFSPDGRFLYVVTELSDEVLVYRTDDYSLLERHSLNGENPQGGAHIALSRDGRYLYATLRVSSTANAAACKLADGVAVFERNADGLLRRVGYRTTGGHPRHFALSIDGGSLIVACRDSNSVELYPIDPTSGALGDCIDKVEVSNPVFVLPLSGR